MLTLTTDTVTAIDELFCHYPGQTSPQGAELLLDIETGVLSCRYNPEIGNSRPARHFHGIVQVASLPVIPTADTANQLMKDVAELAQAVLDGAWITWDGNNHVGRLSPTATQAWDEITDLVAALAALDEASLVGGIDPGDYFDRTELGTITADTTDEELDALAAQAVKDAAASGLYGYTVMDEDAAIRFLHQHRDQLRD